MEFSSSIFSAACTRCKTTADRILRRGVSQYSVNNIYCVTIVVDNIVVYNLIAKGFKFDDSKNKYF